MLSILLFGLVKSRWLDLFLKEWKAFWEKQKMLVTSISRFAIFFPQVLHLQGSFKLLIVRWLVNCMPEKDDYLLNHI